MSGRVVQATLRPGDPGTRKLVSQYGERLVCVRHRIDPERGRRIVTVELVVAEAPLEFQTPTVPDSPPRLVRVDIAMVDRVLRQRVIAAGGRWLTHEQCWELPARAARALRLRPTRGREE